MRQRILSHELSAINSRYNTNVNESEHSIINHSHISDVLDFNMQSSIINSSHFNEMDYERRMTSTPLPTNISESHNSHRALNVSFILYIFKSKSAIYRIPSSILNQ